MACGATRCEVVQLVGATQMDRDYVVDLGGVDSATGSADHALVAVAVEGTHPLPTP
jgi:hypothetical protein